MKLTIFMSPTDVQQIEAAEQDIYIVIDVIRATTSMTAMLESRASKILAADSVEQARQAASLFPQRLLCGERRAKPLPGFDYGNSPREFARTDLTGKELILTTTNGTRAFFACPEHSIRLAGCFYNGEAVTRYAIQQARKQNSNIVLVCAGEKHHFALDDTVCAGFLAQEIIRQQPDIEIHESVTAALTLHRQFPVPELIAHCHSAKQVIKAGLGEDITFCMSQNKSTAIAQIVGIEDSTGLLELTLVG